MNAKQVLRILQVNTLTLERHTGICPNRTHDGVEAALRSNVKRVARTTWGTLL